MLCVAVGSWVTPQLVNLLVKTPTNQPSAVACVNRIPVDEIPAPSGCCGAEQFSQTLLKTENIILRMVQELLTLKLLMKTKLAAMLTLLCLSSLI